MSTPETAPAKKPRVGRAASAGAGGPTRPARGSKVLDAALVASFLSLTFLLGLFPLKDTDFWWHLRTGDLIRQSGVIPKLDIYTFTSADKPWIDLHWTFQVAVSWLYQRGGVPALTLAKSAITCVAIFLLVTARRREWPVWAMLLAWLPALLVLNGRNYIRPETFTLLYLSMFLAILSRIDRLPWLAALLPLVQAAWVNAQGLFVFGPILLTCALLDAMLRGGAFAPGKKRWWTIVGVSSVLTCLACFVNPYGINGALYPLEIARTMANPIFSDTIEELKPIPKFIAKGGLVNPSLWLHFLTAILGALSFLVPMSWVVMTRLHGAQAAPPAKVEKTRKRKPSTALAVIRPVYWRLSLFRLLLFVAFTALSWRATRNSHQFAAVVGALTAWNFGEWLAGMNRRAGENPQPGSLRSADRLPPRIGTLLAIALLFAFVASGNFYDALGEGRTIGLGEQPLWFPHEAVKFSGGPGMPDRFLGFHIGVPSLNDYYFGPRRKDYVDARLEVIGADLYERYYTLQERIIGNGPGWRQELDAMGRPVIVTDLEYSGLVAAALQISPTWRCVWFDPVAAVFVHVSYANVIEKNAVDFLERHFHPDPRFEPSGVDAVVAECKGLKNVAAGTLQGGRRKSLPLILLGLDRARRVTAVNAELMDGWKYLGLFESLREAAPDGPEFEPVPRFRLPFDPVFDLSAVRRTYAFRRALDANPNDFLTLMMLGATYRARGMGEAASPVLDRLTRLTPINTKQSEAQREARAELAMYRSKQSTEPPGPWANLSELSRNVNELLLQGRAATAAEYLERAGASEARSWDDEDRIATLWLHLGEPARARAAWRKAVDTPRPGLRHARIAVTYLIEQAAEQARESFQAAIAADPELFEAYYGLAMLEQDLGRAPEALSAARQAVKRAANDVSRQAAQEIVTIVTPYAHAPLAGERGR